METLPKTLTELERRLTYQQCDIEESEVLNHIYES